MPPRGHAGFAGVAVYRTASERGRHRPAQPVASKPLEPVRGPGLQCRTNTNAMGAFVRPEALSAGGDGAPTWLVQVRSGPGTSAGWSSSGGGSVPPPPVPHARLG